MRDTQRAETQVEGQASSLWGARYGTRSMDPLASIGLSAQWENPLLLTLPATPPLVFSLFCQINK